MKYFPPSQPTNTQHSDPFPPEVIRGWDLGVKSMKKGEKSYFEIPSDYAYGNNAIPGLIPANSTLMFEIELLSWK